MDNQQGTLLIAGVDEAGRGPLAGPVVAAAVILDPKHLIEGLKDSKCLTQRQRESLFSTIQDKALACAIAKASAKEIDSLNIHHASLLAMQRAVEQLLIKPDEVLIDGKFCPSLAVSSRAIIKGDSLISAISAASILAKVSRDREMTAFAKQYPNYAFEKHKGYPTPEHYELLKKHGPCPIHRRSYKGVIPLNS